LESDYSGFVIGIVQAEGAEVPVSETIAWVGESGEVPPLAVGGSSHQPDSIPPLSVSVTDRSNGKHVVAEQERRSKATPAATRLAKEHGLLLPDVTPSGHHGEIRARDIIAAATPLANRVAMDRGIPIESIAGSGRSGKVFLKDLPLSGVVYDKACQPECRPVDRGDRREELTSIQKITGERLLESVRNIPSVTNHLKADVTELVGIINSLKQHGTFAVSVNAFIMLGIAKALREHARLNSTLDGNELVLKGNINLGMAVAGPKGLVVPVVKDADGLTLGELTLMCKRLSERARDGSLSKEELEGGTFTVSNLGMYGTEWFTPIINPPQAAIMGICAIEDLWKFDGATPTARKVVGLSLTYDHRIIDGAGAAEFQSCVRKYLEHPLRIMA
jgi:pyruvate dehydrogenase E2 component (dihydrolipoamide acetyltransferase)